jgi:hypothetical protein
MTYKVANIVTAGIILVLGLFLGADAVRLGSGWGLEGPRPGFFPFVMAAIMVVGCGIVIYRTVRGKPSKNAGEAFVPPEAIRPILTVLIPACLMVLFTEIVGLYVAGMIYLALYIRWVGDFKWRVAILIGVAVPMAFYYIFEKIFLIPMPAGLYGSSILRF